MCAGPLVESLLTFRIMRLPRVGLALSLLLSAPVALATLTTSHEAHASVSFAVGYDALVSDSDAVAIVTPMESRSVWEDNRIVTYTHIKVEEGVAGALGTGSETWVRTLGGAVGKIGQLVDGEPVFVMGKSTLVFARALKPGTFQIVARAQGQYPVVTDPQTKRRSLMKNANCGVLVPRMVPTQSTNPDTSAAGQAAQPGQVAPAGQAPIARGAQTAVVAAVDVIHGRMLEDVARDIAGQWKRLHK
jgi:hypothetical protein